MEMLNHSEEQFGSINIQNAQKIWIHNLTAMNQLYK